MNSCVIYAGPIFGPFVPGETGRAIAEEKSQTNATALAVTREMNALELTRCLEGSALELILSQVFHKKKD